ncbi:MAG: Bifunctional phosphoglucose/phosphomannose isomerase [Dehalococcoidia bacterium]|nr:Bifunctional phosphoglucose/phosphomannose isomerase [Dehalococcoidia bacterium]
MHILDDQETYRRVDPSGMRDLIRGLHLQCLDAWTRAKALPIPPEYRGVNNIVVSGMGGSAIGGDIVRAIAYEESPVPFSVLRDYTLPAFVDSNSLVVASSYSGNTEEVLSVFDQALERRAKVMALTAGGRLLESTQRLGLPTYVIPYKGPPRTAVGHGVMPLLWLLCTLGFLTDKEADVEETTAVLESLSQELSEETPYSRNPAKMMAAKLHGRLALVYGAGILSPIASRWKAQMNENGKSWAFHELLPELHHNAVAGYRFPEWLAQKVLVIFLASSSHNHRIQERYRITQTLLDEAGVEYERVDAVGKCSLSQTLSAALYGDYVSLYLAILNGVDPTPVDALDFVKGALNSSLYK